MRENGTEWPGGEEQGTVVLNAGMKNMGQQCQLGGCGSRESNIR